MFRLKIETDNEAFRQDPSLEIARILREVADQIYGAVRVPKKKLRDVNGNTVGEYRLN
jgi:hypothetical protein